VSDREQFAIDVRCGLTKRPRELPSRYLYDELGSALFEAICRLPWYPITRAENRLLASHGARAFRRVAPATVVELGSGSGAKLRTLIEAVPARPRLDVHVVDLSRRALEVSAQALGVIPHVQVTAHAASYEMGLREAVDRSDVSGPILVLFLGSNIGNFDPAGAARFLDGIRGVLRPGDALLIGVDLVKPHSEMVRAYDDPLGVTAAFNRNLLVRINRELDGDFEIAAYKHLARWNAAQSRVEMHLMARADQVVHVEGSRLTIAIERGETIWTESSYKYTASGVADLLTRAGFAVESQWVDAPGAFTLTLAGAA
jgi:L-histidine N-alpha-methyltransferase